IQMKIPVMWPTEDELPLVIDKSAAMRFRDLVGEREYASRPVGDKRGPARKKSAAGQLSGARRPKTGKPQAPPRQKSVSVQPQTAPVRQKPVASETRHRKGRLSYEEVQKLSFEQRMAYYKQAYGNEDSPKKQEAATAVKSRVVPKGKSQVPAHQESPKPVEQPSAQPQKKAGLLQRLLGKLNRHA
ncbi:MAG: hypothetical protein GXY60_01600, partial [Spirochaetales bacterium]|nr:hypothetical protein [Spirochaetales bacterium]